MAKYRLSNEAKEDLIRIHHYGVEMFGIPQADKYFDAFFECFESISQRLFSFESVDYIKNGYRRCVCGVDSIYFRIEKGTVEIAMGKYSHQPRMILWRTFSSRTPINNN